MYKLQSFNSALSSGAKSFLELVYPRECAICNILLGESEIQVCLHCYGELPRAFFSGVKDNPVEKLFWGRVKLDFASSFLKFHDGSIVQDLLHRFKYKGEKEIGTALGILFGQELKNTIPNLQADTLIPVPLHKRKERLRGYNQAKIFAQGLQEVIGGHLEDASIIKSIETSSQTKLNRLQRWNNIANSFLRINPVNLTEKNVFIIDDVVTTGATIEALANQILPMKPNSINVLTLAMAE